MSAEPPFLSRARDLTIPSPLDHNIGNLIADGYSDDEVLAEAVPAGWCKLPADRRGWLARIDAIRRAAAAELDGGGQPARRPGRPGWTAELFQQHLAEARGATPAPQTWPALAANFVSLAGAIGLDPDHLRQLNRKHGRE